MLGSFQNTDELCSTVFVLLSEKRKSFTRNASTARASNAMNVILYTVASSWKVVINNMSDVFNIKASTCNIRCNKNL